MNNRLNKLFWFMAPKALDVKSDKHLIIHQTLAHGSIEDIRYLFRLYPKAVIRKTFLQAKKGLYDSRAVAFAKELLNIRRLDYRQYIKNVSKALS